MDNSLSEMAETSHLARLAMRATETFIARNGFGGKKDYNNPAFRLMVQSAADCPLRALVVNAGGADPEILVRLFLRLINSLH